MVLALCAPSLGIKNVSMTPSHRMLDWRESPETFFTHSLHITDEETRHSQPGRFAEGHAAQLLTIVCVNAGTSSTAFLTFSVAISESRGSTEWYCIFSKSRQEFEKHPVVQLFIA